MDKLSPFTYRPKPDWLLPLIELALDLRWTWNHGGDILWKTMDAEAWTWTENPWWMLQSLPQEHLKYLVQEDEAFKRELQRLIQSREEYLTRPGWFATRAAPGQLNTIAYFSMEFALGEALPLYAGGLGVLAGDYLKTASDMGVPIIGIGLLYQEGYLRQTLDASGWQVEAYPHNDPTNLPISPVLDASGGWLRIPLELPGRTALLRVWQVRVGRATLYLLDSNDPINSPVDRSITYQLYDDRQEFRLMQEMALGIGGWRVIKALNLPVELCHMNEGHTAFLILERARSFMRETGHKFNVALWAARPGNVFTTHTPVAAGFDSFSPNLIRKYFRDYCQGLGISCEELIALGCREPGNPDEPFNMAALALRGSFFINAVSRIHEEVSRNIFQSEYPDWPRHEVPIGYITNGVHVPSWDSEWADALWTEAGGKGCWQGSLEHLTPAIQDRTDLELWTLRNQGRRSLISSVRQRLVRQLQQNGNDAEAIEHAKGVLDPNVLTLGFARRFTSYKRLDLILHDKERLIRLLTHAERPIQIIVAGKAHPKDEEGKRLIQEFVHFARLPAVRSHVVFLLDYSLALAEELVQGTDLWLNTPRRPWEACGTSGMKVLVNGGLNLSELDGWWAEAYSSDVGWAIGDGRVHTEPEWDSMEAEQLYDILERQVVPDFYDRDDRGVPLRWLRKIRASMSQLAPEFSSNRMLQQYVERIYLPSTVRFRERMANKGELAAALADWHGVLRQYWAELHCGAGQVAGKDNRWEFELPVYLGDLNPDFVSVEIYADPLDGDEPVRSRMMRGDRLPGAVNGYLYRGSVPATRPAAHFTLRIIPGYPTASVPLEENHILWHSVPYKEAQPPAAGQVVPAVPASGVSK